jgi:2-acylglycerol O-acyltransferase 2
MCTFATEGKAVLVIIHKSPISYCIPATGFSKEFPGIKPHLLTLSSNFQIPIYREILLALGICSVSKKSCSNILKAGPGYAITIVVGGAAESLSARPGTADLTLRRRCVIGLFGHSI